MIKKGNLYLFLKYVNEAETPKSLVSLLTFMAYLYFIFLASIVWLLTIGKTQMEWHPRGPLVADIRSSWSATKTRMLKCFAAVVWVFKWKSNQSTRSSNVLPARFLALYTQQASWQQSGIECLLCRNLIWTKEKLLFLPCHKWHVFHYDCAEEFVSTHRRCPVCHEAVFTEDGNPMCSATPKATSKKQAKAKNTASAENKPSGESTEDDMAKKKKKKQKRNKKIKNKNKVRRRG
ncbi:hypothetical protein LTR13_009475 [Exophiala sideris]|nr:hypothetical protein LTR13_009475 [Exophiala sideris]